MDSMQEARAYPRYPVHAHAEIRLSSGVTLECESQDLSLSGVFFGSERTFPVGQKVHVVMTLSSPEGVYRVVSEGYVARVEEEGLAVAFNRVRTDGFPSLCAATQQEQEEAITSEWVHISPAVTN